MSRIPIEELLNTIKKVFIDKATGELEIEFNSGKRYIYFINGNIRYARSEFDSEKVGQFFLKDSLITNEQLENALIEAKNENKILGEYLSDKNIAKKDDLKESVKKLIVHIATQAFVDGFEKMNFQRQQQYIDDSILLKVSTANVLLEGSRLINDNSVFQNFLNENKERIPFLTDNPNDLIKELHLNPQEGFIMSRIDNSTTLNQIASFTGLPDIEVAKMIYALNTVGLIFLKDNNNPTVEVVETDKEEQINFEDHTSGEDAVIEEEESPKVKKVKRDEAFVEYVERFNRGVEKMNYYDILDISREASEDDIKKGYIKQIKRFHPDRHSAKIYFDIVSHLENITNKVTEAYNCLTDPIKKEQYDVDLKKKDDAKLRNRDVDQKDQIFQNAMSLLREGRQYHAVTMLQRGLQIAPSDKRFNLELGKLLSHRDETSEKAKFLLKKVIKIDPSCTDSYLFLARMAKRQGDDSEARKFYNDLLTFDPLNKEAEEYLNGGKEDKKDIFSSFKGMFGKKK